MGELSMVNNKKFDIPEPGDRAPSFTLPGANGKKVKLADFAKCQAIVLYFYPKDLTSGCSQEAADFSKHYKKFQNLGAEVIGMSPDSPALHDKFVAKFKIPFPLASDESKEVLQKYGVWVEKSMYGRQYMGVLRTTLILSPKGKVLASWVKVKVPGHVEEVLSKLKELL